MTEGDQDASGDLAPDKAEQADDPAPQVSFNQVNQQILGMPDES